MEIENSIVVVAGCEIPAVSRVDPAGRWPFAGAAVGEGFTWITGV